MRSFFFKVLVVVGSIVVLIGAIAVSIALFAIALTALVVFFGYLWWRTRDVRKRMREREARSSVIEGEVLRPPQHRAERDGRSDDRR